MARRKILIEKNLTVQVLSYDNLKEHIISMILQEHIGFSGNSNVHFSSRDKKHNCSWARWNFKSNETLMEMLIKPWRDIVTRTTNRLGKIFKVWKH